jgi:hypothetical protein
MAVMDELGIGNQLRWKATSMGIFTGGRLHEWGTPFALFRFNEITLLSRLRYRLFASQYDAADGTLSKQSRRIHGLPVGVVQRSTIAFGNP